MKAASIIALILAAIDAGYLGVWAFRRSLDWSVIEANFESDMGKSAIGAWHLEHVRSVGVVYDKVLLHSVLITVLLIVAAVLFAKRKSTR